MIALRKKKEKDAYLAEIPLSEIEKSPDQTRKSFDEYELSLLAASIKENGLLQPITVRKTDRGYMLIAGERRVRAALSAGLKTLPAIIMDSTDRAAAIFTLLENLQRSDLTIFEEAEGIKRLITVYGVSQCDAAARLGMAQSTLSNKLRILRLSPEQRTRIEAAALTERHARALLRLPDSQRDEVLDRIIAEELRAAQTEQLVEELLKPQKPQKAGCKSSIGDVRLFANSLSKIVDTMIRAGYSAKTRKNETDSYIEYTVRIDKQSAQLRLF
ncbi:MAG: ParB/RepB/Spo0J family partition protein [Clostridia bacterium]|nr:ParB/RepB/Spo0J family partition protein [Clostridia bacterium]